MGEGLYQHHLVTGWNVSKTIACGFDEPQSRERHVIANKGQPVGGDHAQNLVAGRRGLGFVRVELYIPIRMRQ